MTVATIIIVYDLVCFVSMSWISCKLWNYSQFYLKLNCDQKDVGWFKLFKFYIDYQVILLCFFFLKLGTGEKNVLSHINRSWNWLESMIFSKCLKLSVALSCGIYSDNFFL